MLRKIKCGHPQQTGPQNIAHVNIDAGTGKWEIFIPSTVTPLAIAIKIDIIRPDKRHQKFVANPYRADSRPLRAALAPRPGASSVGASPPTRLPSSACVSARTFTLSEQKH